MHSENNSNIQNTPKRSFIEEARQAQIVTAAIDTLAELGFARTSLAQIAKKAGISTSLIPYHFKDKDELMDHTIAHIFTSWELYVQEKLAEASLASDKLRIYIEANLAYMGTRLKFFAAFIELVFNARNAEGKLKYLSEDEDTPSVIQLKNILIEGQKSGEFRSFDVTNLALAIRATIDQYLGISVRKPNVSNLESYTAEVIEIFEIVTRKEQAHE